MKREFNRLSSAVISTMQQLEPRLLQAVNRAQTFVGSPAGASPVGNEDGAEPLVCLPLRAQEKVIGAVVVFGLLSHKAEFEPRMRQSKERLSRLEAERQETAQAETQRAELRLIIGRLEEFTERISFRGAPAEETRGTRGSSERGQRRRSQDLPACYARRTAEAPRCRQHRRGGHLRDPTASHPGAPPRRIGTQASL